MYNANLDATQETHGFLLLDVAQDKNDGLRFGTKIFTTDIDPLGFYSDIGDEACGIQL